MNRRRIEELRTAIALMTILRGALVSAITVWFLQRSHSDASSMDHRRYLIGFSSAFRLLLADNAREREFA